VKPSVQLVVFALEDQRYALRLDTVERVFRAAEITPLPKAPEVVLGVVDVRGTILPAVDIRRRFRLPPRELEPSDRLIIARASQRRLALVVDSVSGLAEIPEDRITGAATLPPGTGYLEGVAILDDGLVMIHDLDQLLAFQEVKELEAALSRAKGGRGR
jgi:purine-binding chemotaxis protein CheW